MSEGTQAVDFVHLPDTSGPAPVRRTGHLPPEAARLFNQLSIDAEERNDLVNGTHSRVQVEVDDMHRIRASIASIEEHYPKVAKNDREYLRLKKQLEAAKDRVDNFRARYAEQQGSWQSLARIVQAIGEWVAGHAHAVIVMRPATAPKLAKGERPVDVIERLRGTVAALRQEAARVERATLTTAEAKAAARAYVADLAGRARPDVRDLLNTGHRPYFPNIPEVATTAVLTDFATIYAGGKVRDGMSVVAWLAPDLLTAALDREIDAIADDRRAMTAEAKARRLAEIAAEILAAERQEEALIRLAADSGIVIDRRPDADPRAVLMIDAEPDTETNLEAAEAA